MKSKDFSDDVGVLVLNAYQEYVNNTYPKDKNVYLIRGNNRTISKLLELKDVYMIKPAKENSNDCFMGFRTEVDGSLKDGQLIFGPEMIDLEWSI